MTSVCAGGAEGSSRASWVRLAGSEAEVGPGTKRHSPAPTQAATPTWGLVLSLGSIVPEVGGRVERDAVPNSPSICLVLWAFVPTLCCAQSLSHVRLCDCSRPGSSVHGDSPGKNTGVGCHALLQGIFLTPGIEPRLPALQEDSLPCLSRWLPCYLLWVYFKTASFNALQALVWNSGTW